MNNSFKHIDEARDSTIAFLISYLQDLPINSKMVLIEDLYGKLRLVIWPGDASQDSIEIIKNKLEDIARGIWTNDIWVVKPSISDADKLIYNSTWDESIPHPEENRLRIMDRYRSRSAWFNLSLSPPWKSPDKPDIRRPPIIVFYSFKGGVGRTTALSAFAISRARSGEKVVVVDGDFDAPGIGTLLAADVNGTTAKWGLVDYLLEKAIDPINFNFNDYYHACRREKVTGSGEILVFPAGTIDKNYLGKLARLDFEPLNLTQRKTHPLSSFLLDVRDNLRPHWIILDVRAGLAETSGIMIGSLAHLNILFGTSSEQSWRGLRLIIEKLGARRIFQNKPQNDCIIVHSMVPRSTNIANATIKKFLDRSRDEFLNFYYAEDKYDIFWNIDDLESSDAPHVPIPIRYDESLADFQDIEDIADSIADSSDFKALATRILDRFGGSLK
jgi:hypothetical protein